VLTVSVEEQNVLDAIAAGASGYLLKGTSLESLVGGIKASLAGESVISAAVSGKLFNRLRVDDGVREAERPVFSQLSEREIEILRLVASGKRNTEIAEELVISPYTVRNHVSRILAKLHLHSRLEAAAYAIKNRVV
jgi:DNA-binding NarL/FixJ family response regulator